MKFHDLMSTRENCACVLSPVGGVVRSPRLTTTTCVRSIGKAKDGDPVVGERERRRQRPLQIDGDERKTVI